jgi:hypothetical protein
LPKEKIGIDHYGGVITRFIDAMKSRINADLSRRGNCGCRVHTTSIRYVWCRERNKSCNEHFHVFILLNRDTYWQLGSFINPSEGQLFFMINEAWSSALKLPALVNSGLVEFKSQPMYINAKYIASTLEYDRFSQLWMTNYESAFYWMSYLAKLDTKEFNGSGRSFGCSQPKNEIERNMRKNKHLPYSI